MNEIKNSNYVQTYCRLLASEKLNKFLEEKDKTDENISKAKAQVLKSKVKAQEVIEQAKKEHDIYIKSLSK